MSEPDEQYESQLAEASAADDAGAPRDDVLEILERLHATYLELVRGGVTPTGLPYPAPTDPLSEGADAIRALAEAVDVMTFDASRVTSGVFAVGRIPYVDQDSLRVYLGTNAADASSSDAYLAVSDSEVAVFFVRRGGVTRFAVSGDGVITSGTIPWGQVSGRPSSYPPSAHTHPQSDITGLSSALASKVDDSEVYSGSGNIGGLIPRYDAAGRIPVGTPAAANQAAPKAYVDAAVSNVTSDADRVTSAAYSRTVGSDRYAMWMDGGRWIGRSPSSRRFKSDIRPTELDVDAFLSIPVVTFHRDVDEDDVRDLGAIAEDFADAGLDDLVTVDDDGQIDGIREHRLSWYLLQACQQQRADIVELRSVVDELRSRLEALEAR